MEQKIKTLSQERSEFALGRILNYQEQYKVKNKKNNEEVYIKKEIRNFVIGSPSVILQNGLGQAIAFWASKAGEKSKDKLDQHVFLLNSIIGWLIKVGLYVPNNQNSNDIDYKNLLVSLSKDFSQKEYLLAQKEVISLLEWMKRYANAFWKVDEKEKE